MTPPGGDHGPLPVPSARRKPSRARSSGTASRGWTPGPANGSRSCRSWSAPPPSSTPTPGPCCKPPATPGPATPSPPRERPCSARPPPAATVQRLGRRPGHRETPQPHRRRRPRILGLGDHRGPALHRHPRRGTGAAQPSQLRPVPAARHRRAGAAAADRPVQDRRRAAAGHQPRARRRAQRHHQPDPRHQPRRASRRRLRRSRTPLAAARPGAVPAAYRRREPRDPRRHHPQDPHQRPGPHRH